MICRHCCQNKIARPRRLCFRCYYTPAIKALYPPCPRLGPRPEQTAAELDALVEERRRTAPAWFFAEAEMLGSAEAAVRSRESAERFRAKGKLPRQWRARA